MTSGRSPIPTRHPLGNVYYCDGCVDPNASAEEGDSELEGEDTFVSGRNIDTEIRTDAGDEVIDQAGDTVSVNGESHSDGSTASVPRRIRPHIRPRWLKQRQFLRRLQTIQKVPRRKESTTSALDSLAETAESVIQETTKKATIIRVEDKTEADTKAPDTEASTTAAPTTKEETRSRQPLLLPRKERKRLQ